ncbi:MAG: AI-2E family transporter [Candidatus Margulisiibacteriota bacterium]
MTYPQRTRWIALAVLLVIIFFFWKALWPVLIAIILFYLLNPVVNFLTAQLKLRREISTALALVLFCLAAYLVAAFVFPPFYLEFNQLIKQLPDLIARAQNSLNSLQSWYIANRLPGGVEKMLPRAIENVFSYLVLMIEGTAQSLLGLMSQLVMVIVIPIMTVYMLIDEKKLAKGIAQYVPEAHRSKFSAILKRLDQIMKNYIVGQAILCSIVAAVTLAGLWLLGVDYFIMLAGVAAVAQLIPNVGPVIGMVPAVAVALLESPIMALNVILFYAVVQTILAYYLGPKILGDKLDLHPLTIIVAVVVLGGVMGFWGMLLAAPLVAVAKALYLELSAD